MSRRKIGKVEPISATSPSAPVDVGQTNSIFTDPEGRWVAKRQSEINAGLEEQFTRSLLSGGADAGEQEEAPQTSPGKLSGESDRIGHGNDEDEPPDGEHVAYV